MVDWFWVVGWFCVGYSLAGRAFGLRGASLSARVAWGVALGAVAVFLLIPVMLVWALSGGLPSIGSISARVWGFVAGAAVAGLVAFYRSRAGVGEWFSSGGMRRAAVGVVGIVLVVAVGAGLSVLVNSGQESTLANNTAKPAKEVEPVPVAEVPAASCDCSAWAVCVGPKGGRYCLRPDGSKRYM